MLFSLEGEPVDDDVGPDKVSRALARYLTNVSDVDGARPHTRLASAMSYALLGGGKRVRPRMVIECARAVAGGAALDDVIALAAPAAVAVELVHTYSLVHDDLPAMDDDVLRRGRPTVHIAFDEATAILAGDALLADAFALLASAPTRAAEQVRELALAAGSCGLVSGQCDDLDNEGALAAERVDLASIHKRKTARLFAACAVLGGIAVDAGAAELACLRAYGEHVGLAFQIADDVIDACGDARSAGKNVGRDAERRKVTYATRYGVDVARALAQEASARAVRAAERLGAHALVDIALAAARRDR